MTNNPNAEHQKNSRLLANGHLILMSVAIAMVCHAAALSNDAQKAGDLQGIDTAIPRTCALRLAKNLRALDCFYIKYAVKREFSEPGRLVAGDELGNLYFDSGKMQLQYDRIYPSPQRPEEFTSVREEMSYDGDIFYVGTPTPPASTLFKLLGKNPHHGMARNTFVVCPYLSAAGYELPQSVAEWPLKKIEALPLRCASTGKISEVSVTDGILYLSVVIPDPSIESASKLDLETLLQQSAGNKGSADRYKQLRNRRADRRVNLWLDETKGYALTRREDWTLDGKPIKKCVCRDFRYDSGADIWLPEQCVVEDFLKSPAPSHWFHG